MASTAVSASTPGTVTAGDHSERVSFRRLLWAGPLAIVLAAAANALVYFVAAQLGAMPQDVLVPGMGQPVSLSPVIFNSVIGAVGGVIAFAVIARFARRPIRLFRIVAAIVLVLSFVTPFSIPDAPAAMRAVLLLMHVVVAAAVVGVLTTQAREQ